MRICCRCKVEKDDICFSWKSKEKGLLAKECKECHAIQRKNYYLRNKTKEIARAKQQAIDIRNWFNNLKNNLKCTKCGESHPATLQFHHINNKKFEISMGVSYNLKKETILKEISNCIVLCANCHMKEHWRH